MRRSCVVVDLGAQLAATSAAWRTYGIDVSAHQDTVDWEAVAGDKIEFAYIKATEGGDFVDDRFRENWVGAASAGWSEAPTTSSPCAPRAQRRRRTS